MAKVPDLVVKSKVRELITGSKCRLSSDVFDTLKGTVARYVEQSTKRAKANGRQTIRGHDFLVG